MAHTHHSPRTAYSSLTPHEVTPGRLDGSWLDSGKSGPQYNLRLGPGAAFVDSHNRAKLSLHCMELLIIERMILAQCITSLRTFLSENEQLMTTKEYMCEVTVVDPKWLIELASRFFKVSNPTKMSKRKSQERIGPLYDKYHEPNSWRLSKRRP
ncbi:hypothetical protein LguiA_005233 [Lonicera macranthoides]